MRLHRLEITAFGPFAAPTVVDFDALSSANVFLLCGDTGAGKSTVLDGVCFALYGDVSSDRGKAHQLRSHFAPAGARPLVVLEATVSERRLRFTRSPAWQRPKRRGTGLTTEQARVLVEELVEDVEGQEWVARTTRLDEAGHLVTDLLGMNKDQFSQVVLLPQGQFDTFLSSASEDRQQVLTQLFRTRRFDRVERWLVERRTALRRESQQHQDRIGTRLHRIAEAAAVELPDQLSDLDALDVEDLVRAWATEVTTSAGRAAEVCEHERDERARELARSGTDLATATARHQWRERHRAAVDVLARLATTASTADEARQRVETGRRAAPVAPLVDRAARTKVVAERAERASGAAVAAIGSLLAEEAEGPVDDDGGPTQDTPTLAIVTHAAARAAERATVARTLVPRAQDLADTTAQRDRIDTELSRLTDECRQLEPLVEADPALVSASTERLDTARALAAEVPSLEHRAQAVAEEVRRETLLRELEQTLVVARAAQDISLEAYNARREEHLSVRQQRLDGMAVELARELAVGAGCPVCGSGQHPSPAVGGSGGSLVEDERRAQKRLDDADIAVQTAREETLGVETRIAVLRESASSSPTAAESPDAVQDALSAALAARDSLPALDRQQRRAVEEAADHRRRHLAATASLEALRRQRVEVEARRDRVADDLRTLLADPSDALTADALRQVAARHDDAARALTEARDALERHHRARHEHETARVDAQEAATRAGFHRLEDVGAALLTDAETAAILERLRGRDAEEREALDVLDRPEAVDAVTGPAPDVAAAERAHCEATTAHLGAASRAARAEERREAVTRHIEQLRATLAEWAPVREQLDLVQTVAELAEGKGPDNAAQMRLSAYVLAARLAQVVAAANERLERMTDGRYLLEHSARRAVGDRRGGLSLLVRDQWTDETRDPVTLSGGETFLVSLALALGLADVVTGESGGARIETLFVDEGFGSLDPDTLELVMDTLDGLREGGRAVGVVSHVPELRSRIGTQLVVHKGPSGSWITQGAPALAESQLL